MKKNFIRRVSVILLCVALLCIQVPFMASASPNSVSADYEMPSSISANKGEIVTVPVTLNFTPSTNRVAINGIMFTVEYDTEKLSFISGSEASDISGLTAFDKNGVISCAWLETDSILIASGITAISLQFRVLDTADGTADINFEHKYLYESDVSGGSAFYNHITCTTATASTAVSIGVDGDVQVVKDAIDAIGTVTYSKESLEKINQANKLYNNLTNSQKALVDNYETLTKAIEEYESLKNQEAQDAIDEEVAAYKKAHKNALKVTVSNVKLDDWEILENAYKAYSDLTPKAQAELLQEYRLLGFLLEMLKDAKAAADEEAKLAQKKEWELKLAEAYVFGGYDIDTETGKEKEPKTWISGLLEPDSEWLDIATKTSKNVTANDYMRLNYFKETWYDNITNLYPAVIEVMNNKSNGLSDQFLAAYEKAKELYDIANTPKSDEELEAENFISNFGYVLGLTTKTVSYDDLQQLEIAKTVYQFLSSGAQELLTDEYALIESLYNTASALDPGSDSEGDGNGGSSDVAGPAGDTFDQSAEANSFNSAFTATWASVLSMDPNDVTGEDYPVLLAMITNYETLCALNPAVATLLGDQMKTIYEMADKAKALYDGETGSSDALLAGPAVAGWDANNVLKFMNRDMGVIVWILLALLCLSTVVFVVLRVFYYSLRKNKALFAGEEAVL